MLLRGLLALTLLPIAFVACRESQAAPDEQATLRFTAIPDQNTTELTQKFAPVAAWLSAELGFRCEYVPAADYAASVEMFKNGDVQLAWFGGLTGLQARQAVPGAVAIAQGAEDPRFVSYFIAHQSTGLERSDEFPIGMKGMSFTFGSNASTSGRLMPDYFIRQNSGMSPTEFFGAPPGFSGAHDKTALLVMAGEVQCGALNYAKYDSMVKSGAIDPEVCKLIWVTPEYADYNFTAHPDIDEMFGEGSIVKLQQALIGLDDPALLAAFQRSSLIEASDADFAALAEVAKSLDMLR